jgi:hypothetical protein
MIAKIDKDTYIDIDKVIYIGKLKDRTITLCDGKFVEFNNAVGERVLDAFIQNHRTQLTLIYRIITDFIFNRLSSDF